MESKKEEKLPILRASDIGWWDWDFEKDLVDCDERVKTLFGLPLNEPVKFDHILEHAHPDDRALFINRSREIRSRTGSYEIEYRVVWPDGSVRWILGKCRSSDNSNGEKPLRAMGIALDITPQKQAEEALKQSEARFRALIDASSDVYRMSPDWKDMLHLRSQDFLANSEKPSLSWPQDCIHPDDRSCVMMAVNGAIREKKTLELEHRVLRIDGSIGWTFFRAVPVLNSNGEIVEWLGAATDVTERKQAEQQLAAAEQANRAKDHFLAVLSHELRTALTPVVLGISLLADKPELDAEIRETLEMVRSNIELEARLIDDLLDVTRIARGKIELNRNPVELCSVVQRAVEVCKPDIEARRLHFGLDLGPSASYWVDADASRLQQVFWNLLKNAVKFTPHDGCLSIRCRPEDDRVSVEITDSGIGIEPEALPRVFNAFEQAERSITRQFGGLGLGLAISKALVELHGGTIEARSEGRNKGASFHVHLPLSIPAGQAQAPVFAPTRESTRPLRVLLVEDHGITAEMIRMVLEERGHSVEIAGDIATALELVDSWTFDLLLSDLGLPDGSGYDLLRELRARRYNFPAIALTGYGQEEDIRQSYQAGFGAHLTKPASREAIDEAMALVTRG